MARGAKRQTFWEGATGSMIIDDSTIQGAEALSSVDLADFAPCTLVRVRGVITCAWRTTPLISSSNLTTVIHVAVRKVVLDATGGTYTPPVINLDDEQYLSTEDILMFGAIKLDGAMIAIQQDTNTIRAFTRASGFMNVDIKAMRRFQSAEERLVVECQLQHGQTTIQTDVFFALRMLFKAG